MIMFRHKCTQLFRNGKMVKTRYPQPKEGKARILMDKWPEMLTFVFDKSKFESFITIGL